MSHLHATELEALRHRIRALERPSYRPGGALPFGVAGLDGQLPEGGLARGTLHEVAGGGADAGPAAAGALFIAGITGRLGGMVLWCAVRPDIFAPGLAAAGLPPDRVLYAHAPDEDAVRAVLEEALRHAALSAVVGELTQLGMTASRRLVLAAEKSGVMALVLRRARDGKPLAEGLTAAATRWVITPRPSAPLPTAGIGRPRWRVELARCRGGNGGAWEMEACDAQGYLCLSTDLADRSAAQEFGQNRAKVA